ncbi:Cytochrome b5 type B (outer mitochondrial membrane) [Borealophlyctis nickersoniae]|nr:Cytochrome b5 type B (outer mitochondrial membrane) [Borealophlyctis nickersoniae]
MAEVKYYDWAEVAQHNSRNDIWMVIDGKVYDITKFLDEHPGGEEVLLEQAGVDATDAFEEIGHSDDARDLLKTMYKGDLKPSVASMIHGLNANAVLGIQEKANKAAAKAQAKAVAAAASTAKAAGGSSNVMFVLVPIVAVLGFVIYKYLETSKK